MRPIRFIARHKHAAIVTLVATLALAVAAGAYWTQGGTGSGTAATGTTVDITVNQTSVITGLYPGGPAQALAGDFDNPNSSNVYVTTVTAAVQPGWTTQADPSKPACTAGDFLIAGSAPVNAQVIPGTGVGAWGGLTIAMVDGGANQDNCKNVSVPIEYTAS